MFGTNPASEISLPTPRYGTGSRDRDNEYRTIIREINLYIDNCIVDLRFNDRGYIRARLNNYMNYLIRNYNIHSFGLSISSATLYLTWVFAGDSTTFTEHRDISRII
jgi:hypothetical protein